MPAAGAQCWRQAVACGVLARRRGRGAWRHRLLLGSALAVAAACEQAEASSKTSQEQPEQVEEEVTQSLSCALSARRAPLVDARDADGREIRPRPQYLDDIRARLVLFLAKETQTSREVSLSLSLSLVFPHKVFFGDIWDAIVSSRHSLCECV